MGTAGGTRLRLRRGEPGVTLVLLPAHGRGSPLGQRVVDVRVVPTMTKEPKMTRFHVAIAILALALVGAAPAFAAETYTYDNQSRLTDVAYQNGGSLHYTYDANGNILSVITSLAAAVEGTEAAYQFALGPTTPNPGSGSRSVFFTMASRG